MEYELGTFYTDMPNFGTHWPYSIQQKLLEVENAYKDPNGLYKGKRVNTNPIRPGNEVAYHINRFLVALKKLYQDLDELEATGIK
jgi:hypothetical protein